MLDNLSKYTTLNTPFAPKLSYIFLIAFVVIFAGGSSVLYFRILPDSRIERVANDLKDPYFMASQTLHAYDRFLVSLNLYSHHFIDHEELQDLYDALCSHLNNY